MALVAIAAPGLAKLTLAGPQAPHGSDPPRPARETAVATTAEFARALEDARPGDHLVLDDGEYAGDFVLAADGADGAPIVIRPRNQAGAVLTGRLDLAGRHNWAQALTFVGEGQGQRDAPLRIGGDYATVSRCSFSGGRGIILTSQQHFRIGYNSFTGSPTAGVKGRFDQIFIDIEAGEDTRLPEHGRIFRNLFMDRDNSSSESHSIFVGPAGGRPRNPSLHDLVIEYNFIDTRRRRSIYTKRAGTIQFNHIEMTRGAVGIRHGIGGRVHGNVVRGARDAIINGADHDIRGNDIDSPLQLMAEHRSRGDNHYNAADRALLVGNRGNIVVGRQRGEAKLERPVRGVRIYAQVGEVVRDAEEDTLVEASAALWSPEPVRLTRSEVGPKASPAA